MLYLESGNVPIRFILKARRLNFLWYILNEDEDSLIHSFFKAQCDKSVRGDWVKTVQKDIEELDISMDFESIKNTSKITFKKLVKEKVRLTAFNYLIEIQKSHSKAKNVTYSELKMQEYLTPKNSMTIKEKCFIFAARTRMIDIYGNFKQGKTNILCRKCLSEVEEQIHLLDCPALNDNSIMNARYLPVYEDIFGDNMAKIEIIGKILLKKYSQLTSENKTTMCTETSSAANDIQPTTANLAVCFLT